MEVTLLTISRQCSGILHKFSLQINPNWLFIGELYDKIYDIYPGLDVSDYSLYWWYSNNCFHRIYNFITYVNAVTLMVERTLILIINDSDGYVEDNELLLRELDIELENQKRAIDLYDVKINKKNPTEDFDRNPPLILRTDLQIITYALKDIEPPKYHTSDLNFKMNSTGAINKGWPKCRKILSLLPDEVIERTIDKKASKKTIAAKKSAVSTHLKKKKKR